MFKHSLKLIHIVVLIIELLGTVLFLLWCWMNVSGYIEYGGNYLEISPITFYTFLPVIPAILSLLMLVITINLLRGKNIFFKRWLSNKKILFSLYAIYTLIVFSPIFLFIAALYNESPPYLFPLDDAQATYTITGHNDMYWVLYDTKSDRNKSWVCGTWENGTKGCKEEITRNMETFVAHSNVDLEPFVNKHTKLTGDFVHATKQCIVKQCKDTGSIVGLDIYTIQEAHF